MDSIVRALRKGYERLPIRPLQRPLRWLYHLYMGRKRGRTVVAKVDGVTWELDLNQQIDAGIYFRGAFEMDTAAALGKLVKPGFVILDIGANIGAHALPMARLAGPEGHVHAFEPMSWARGKLQRNLSLNPALRNVTVHPLALSDADRTEAVTFSCSWPMSGVGEGELHPFHKGQSMTETVRLARLDGYAADKGITRVDLVKLDVDGFEYKVVQGGRETLARHRPVIVMELGAYTLAEIGDDVRDLVGALTDLGYRFYRESDFRPFEDVDAMIASIPERATINVIVSAHPLS